MGYNKEVCFSHGVGFTRDLAQDGGVVLVS